MPRLEAEADAGLASQLASLTLRDGTSEAAAIVLDDDIDPNETPAARSERPRVGSIFSHVTLEDARRMLLARSIRRGDAAPDGNCAQRSAGCSVGQHSASDALSSRPDVLEALRAQRKRIVSRLTSEQVVDGHSVGDMLVGLGLPRNGSSMSSFRSLGHWVSSGGEFIAFMWGLADDLQRPVAVLDRTNEGTYLDPVCVYWARPPGGPLMTDNHGAFAYVRLATLLDWCDRSVDWPPKLAIVEFVPGHFSPFIFGPRREGPTGL